MDFFHCEISERAIELAVETLRSQRVSEGARTARFEAALAERLGLVRPVAVNSGTSALQLALTVAGVGPGDEVILPPQTFVATATAVCALGATPVFADIQPHTGNLAPESFAARITPRTKAVIPVHWAGCPCDLDEIERIAEPRGVAVIEDAAHALGAVYRGRPIGSISRFTCFSFQAIKHLTTGDGGAVCCRDERDYRDARRRRWFGIDREAAQPSPLGEREFDIDRLGFKFHMNDLAAAVGLGNLESFPGRLARRREIAERYRTAFDGLPGLRPLESPDDREHAWWLFSVLVEDRDALIAALDAADVPCSVVHRRIDRFTLLGGVDESLTGQTWFDARHLALPLHAGLTDADVERVIGAVQAALEDAPLRGACS